MIAVLKDDSIGITDWTDFDCADAALQVDQGSVLIKNIDAHVKQMSIQRSARMFIHIAGGISHQH